MLHDQNDHVSRVCQRRALFMAPLAAFPVFLIFLILRKFLEYYMSGDIHYLFYSREFIVSPFAALYLTLIWYPIALAVYGVILRFAPHLLDSLIITILVGLGSAEIPSLIFIYLHWQQDSRIIPISVLMSASAALAACGVATGLMFHRISHRHPHT